MSDLQLQRINTRRFVRGEYLLGQPFIVTHRGVDVAIWLPVEEASPQLIQRILDEIGVEEHGHN